MRENWKVLVSVISDLRTWRLFLTERNINRSLIRWWDVPFRKNKKFCVWSDFQLEFHPYVLTHLAPVLEMQKQHGIVTESYGALTPLLRHPTGGPLKPVLSAIAAKVSQKTGKPIDEATVLLLWTRAMGAVAVTASGNPARMQWLGELAALPQLLTEADVEEITQIGRKYHFRHYVSISSSWRVDESFWWTVLEGAHGERFPASEPPEPMNFEWKMNLYYVAVILPSLSIVEWWWTDWCSCFPDMY